MTVTNSMARGDIGNANRANNKVNILGVGVTSTNFKEVLKIISNRCSVTDKMRPFLVVTVNPEFIMLAQNDQEFKKILNSADLAIPDGAGLRFARPGLANVPGRKLVESLIQKGYKMFYLGGKDEVAQAMAKKYGGFYDPGHQDIKNIQPQENQRIIKKINVSHPDILLVAYGAPWQEKWLFANLGSLRVNVVMGVGGTFDYLVGKAKTPPDWVNSIGLEWLWRLAHQPWRWRRQLTLLRYLYKLAADAES